MDQKVILYLGFSGNLGYRLHPETISPLFADLSQGRRQRGGQWCPAPAFEIGAPLFHVWLPGCCIHPILYFKNVPPLLVFGPSFGFWPTLLLNPGDGPDLSSTTHV